MLYPIGISAVLISSKYEDVTPIPMKCLVEKAGHNNFTHEQILQLEKDILKSLGFCVTVKESLYHET